MLTVDDITMIQEALKPQFERIDMRFGRVEERLANFDARFNEIDTRFEQIDARFEQNDARFEQMNSRFEQVSARFDRIDHQLALHDDNFRVIIRRLDKQDRDIEDFAGAMMTSFAGLEDRLDAVADDVAVIKDIVKDHGFRLVRLEGRHGRRA